MASPTRSHPGPMPPAEAFVRLRRPSARAVAVHAGDGTPPRWEIAEHPTRSVVVLGSGPTEDTAWETAAAILRACGTAGG